MTANERVPKGDVFEFTMEPKDSKIYTGIAREPNTFAVPDPADPD
jgi:enterochelin esterase family protein